VPEKVVLKALTTLAPTGALCVTSSAAEVPGAVASPSKVSFKGVGYVHHDLACESVPQIPGDLEVPRKVHREDHHLAA
jgi:hypothetical protein